MRVLLLAPQPFHEVRGTPLAVAALVRTLGELGHDVDLLTFPQGDAWSAPRVRHLRSARLGGARIRPGFSIAKALQDVPFAWRAVRLSRSGAYDVVHAVEESALLVAPFLPRSMKFVVDMDSDLGEQLAQSKSALARALGPLASWWHGRSLRRADLAIVINARLEDAVRRVRPALRVHQLADPPLVSTLTDSDRVAGAALRATLDLGDAPVALYTGNFERYQGVPMMAQAAARTTRAIFVFVGGETEDITELKLRLTPEALFRCRFVGKHFPEMLPRWMALADVLVSPRTLGGNTPFKIYTYLASGKPIVATRLDTHTQVLSDDTAFLVEPTEMALAAGIDTALIDTEEGARRAANGRALLELEYSAARYREKVQAAYATLC
ncbi:MAG: glycosyltransferase family 4 protein [Vicinamibacteria bacterium]|nr:glycosyltransferase family 4 protein [Vicinamibacteria bacterium]